MENNTDNSSNRYLISILLLICNIIILANTKQDEFLQLGMDDYFNFILFVICSIIFIIVLICSLTCGFTLCLNPERYTPLMECIIYGSLFLLLIVMYVFMGKIWQRYPQYSLIFNREYWSQTIVQCPNPCTINKLWPYFMTDIVVRIYSGLLMLFTIIGIPLYICFGTCLAMIGNENTDTRHIYKVTRF